MQPPGNRDNRSFRSRSLLPACPEGKSIEGKSIALLGASVRAAAESAKRAGFFVIGIDQFGDVDTRMACDRHLLLTGETEFEQLAAICSGNHVLQAGGLSRFPGLPECLSSENERREYGSIATHISDPKYLRDLAISARALFPPTLNGDEFKRSPPNGRWLRKKKLSCGGLGVRWYDPAKVPEIDDSELLQQWIAGTPYGATLITGGNTVSLLGVCRTLFTRQSERPFMYAGSLGPVETTGLVEQTLLQLGQELVARSGYRGLVNIDYVMDRRGKLWLLEINPHWTSSSELIERNLIERGQILDSPRAPDSLLRRWIDALGGKETFGPGSQCAGEDGSQLHVAVHLKRIIYARRAIHYDHAWAAPRLRANESLHDIPAEGSVIRAGQPICTLITRIDANESDPMRRHRAAVSELCSQGSYSSPRASAYE